MTTDKYLKITSEFSINTTVCYLPGILTLRNVGEIIQTYLSFR